MAGSSQPAPKSITKFLCSYGGKILPRHPDGKLRYVGGHTRVLAVDRTIPFSELLLKLEELCGTSVRHLRCQLPTEDLDALVSITSDEDLANLIEEYDRSPSVKIRVFLPPPIILNKVSMPPSPSQSKSTSSTSSTSSSSSSTSSSSSYHSTTGGGSGLNSGRSSKSVAPVINRCVHQISPAAAYPAVVEKKSGGIGRNIPHPRYGYHTQGKTCHAGHIYLIHNSNHWQ